MNKIQKTSQAVAAAFASLLISCATDSGHDQQAGQQGSGAQSGASSTRASADSDLAGTEAELRAAHASAGAAKSDAKSCFDKLGACAGDGGAMSQACIDQLTTCLPTKPPAPIGCPKIDDLTPEQITAIDDAVGKAGDIAGEAIDFAGGIIDALLDGGIALPDGGFSFPTGSGSGAHGGLTGGGGLTAGGGFGGQGAGGARTDHNKDRGPNTPGALADGGVPAHTSDAGRPVLPPIDPDASIGGGELCGIPLPVVPIGALKACADTAAADLKGGQDPIAVATAALTCIEKPFADDVAQLCGEVKSACAKPGAPPNICGDVSELCTALAP